MKHEKKYMVIQIISWINKIKTCIIYASLFYIV